MYSELAMSLGVELLSGADADFQKVFNRFEDYREGFGVEFMMVIDARAGVAGAAGADGVSSAGAGRSRLAVARRAAARKRRRAGGLGCGAGGGRRGGYSPLKTVFLCRRKADSALSKIFWTASLVGRRYSMVRWWVVVG